MQQRATAPTSSRVLVEFTCDRANGLVDGYSFWTLSDIFEENYFPSLPFHGGFGGEPKYLSDLQVKQLQAASGLIKEPVPLNFADGSIFIDVDLPPHSVAALSLEFGQRG